jgi:cytoskeleton protein RodZ
MTTIGQRLKEAREDKRLTIEKVFEATRIRVQYLQALEADDLSFMPSPVQARGYLRNYAEFLGLDVATMLENMRDANAQKLSAVVMGPADVLVVPEPERVSEPEPVPVEDATPLVKPKPARRKKADSETVDGSVSTPKRRSRKKVETEPAAILAEEPLIEPLPEVDVEAPVVEDPIIQESVPVEEEVQQEQIEEIPQPVENRADPNVNDSLWQTWLNRLTSILAARNKRPTLEIKDPILPPETLGEEIPLPESQEQTPATQNNETSIQIFKEIGVVLRTRREMLSLHLEEVERNTHVKAHYLESLEMGAMDNLPSTVQTRGMLSNYATFLDLDVDVLLLRFADALQARHRERNPLKPSARKPGQPILASLPPMRSFIAGDLIFGIGIVILLVGFAIWGVSWVLNIQSQREVQPTAPSISDILLASPDPSSFTATPTFVPLESFPGEATVTVVIPTLNVNVNVQVNLVAVERTFMRVIVDGETAFDGRVVPGTAYPFEAENQIEVLVGSGAAIRIVYNGRDQGLLGSFGQVVSNIYLADSIITPTGVPSPTPTITSTPTRTAVPTSTSRFTSTPVPSNTPVP